MLSRGWHFGVVFGHAAAATSVGSYSVSNRLSRGCGWYRERPGVWTHVSTVQQ
ncbi:hypothetical protein BJX62DRAFT_220333 [Aspergillus germanicus]